MTLHLASSLIVLYVILRLIVPLALTRRSKTLLALAALLVSQWHLYQRLFLGGLWATEIPVPLLAAANWLFLSLALLLPILIFRDLALLLCRLGRRFGLSPAWPGSVNVRALAWVGLAAIGAGFGLWQAVKVPEVRSMEVTLPRLPPELDGLTLVQISDLHASPLLTGPRVRRVVERANALAPDLIVLTGDMVDGPVERRAGDVAPLADLRAPLGVWACLGNHEYYSGLDSWLAAFESLGVTVLSNSHAMLEKNGARLALGGVTDRVAGRTRRPLPDVEAAFRGAPDNAVKILMAHRPDPLPESLGMDGVDLQLSGHTHGGQ
ncbi:MAG: metallophosphoesterase, partial [Candidatus Adiutrix sp.]|nr:metallophosphoesterase [Candidatus Adiutrix sp.]